MARWMFLISLAFVSLAVHAGVISTHRVEDGVSNAHAWVFRTPSRRLVGDLGGVICEEHRDILAVYGLIAASDAITVPLIIGLFEIGRSCRRVNEYDEWQTLERRCTLGGESLQFLIVSLPEDKARRLRYLVLVERGSSCRIR